MPGPSGGALKLLTAALLLPLQQHAAATAAPRAAAPAIAAAAATTAAAAAQSLLFLQYPRRCLCSSLGADLGISNNSSSSSNSSSNSSSSPLLSPFHGRPPSSCTGAAARRDTAVAATAKAAARRLHNRAAAAMSSQKKGKKGSAAASSSSNNSSSNSSSSSNLPGFMKMSPDGCLLLSIHATPGAKTSSVSPFKSTDTELAVHIAAPPREGAANEELLDYVAHALKVRKGKLSLELGHKCRTKVVKVSDMKPEEIIERLQEEAPNPKS